MLSLKDFGIRLGLRFRFPLSRYLNTTFATIKIKGPSSHTRWDLVYVDAFGLETPCLVSEEDPTHKYSG